MVRIGVDRLIEPITSFGRPYVATPADDEFECQDGGEPTGLEDVIAPGAAVNAGAFLEADLEGLSIVKVRPGRTLCWRRARATRAFISTS